MCGCCVLNSFFLLFFSYILDSQFSGKKSHQTLPNTKFKTQYLSGLSPPHLFSSSISLACLFRVLTSLHLQRLNIVHLLHPARYHGQGSTLAQEASCVPSRRGGKPEQKHKFPGRSTVEGREQPNRRITWAKLHQCTLAQLRPQSPVPAARRDTRAHCRTGWPGLYSRPASPAENLPSAPTSRSCSVRMCGFHPLPQFASGKS